MVGFKLARSAALTRGGARDIKGKVLGVPVWQLLGGKVRDKCDVYGWVGASRLARSRISRVSLAQEPAGSIAPRTLTRLAQGGTARRTCSRRRRCGRSRGLRGSR